MSEMIKAEGLSFVYPDEGGGQPALSNVSFSVARGEYIAVLGHNGSGKSTLAKLLNLILTPSSGKLYVDGENVTSPESDDDVFSVRKKVGMVFQNPDNQLVATVVEEDVAFGPENLGVPPEEIRRRVELALSAVGMEKYRSHAPSYLSGGQKQRVAIAGVIAMEPDVIVFDESTAMLDPGGRREVLDTMEALNREKGITVLHITHYMEEAARADRIIVVNDGEILLDGSPSEVFSHVEELLAVGLSVPQGTELLYRLRREGYPLPLGVVTEEETVNALLSLLDCNMEKNVDIDGKERV